MSRSYRKPYFTWTAVKCSATSDKTIARRCWRRAQNHALRSLELQCWQDSWDEFLIPLRYEASYNDVWGWGRDGKQHPHFPDSFEHCYNRALQYYWLTEDEQIQEAVDMYDRDQKFHSDLCRK